MKRKAGLRSDEEKRSYVMSRIRGKDTKIERMLRSELYHRGMRYRKNVRHLPGHPDILFIRAKVIVFCDGEFWHGFGYPSSLIVKHNAAFWRSKIERNILRDACVDDRLEEMGYLVLRFWGKEIENDIKFCADTVQEAVHMRTLDPSYRQGEDVRSVTEKD